MIENFLTTEQVAKILQVHPFTILKFLKSGKLRGVKLGRVYRIKESDVQEFLEGRMTGGVRPGKASSSHDYAQHHEYTQFSPQNPGHPEHLEVSLPGDVYTGLRSGQQSPYSPQDRANFRNNESQPLNETPHRSETNEEEGPPHYII